MSVRGDCVAARRGEHGTAQLQPTPAGGQGGDGVQSAEHAGHTRQGRDDQDSAGDEQLTRKLPGHEAIW